MELEDEDIRVVAMAAAGEAIRAKGAPSDPAVSREAPARGLSPRTRHRSRPPPNVRSPYRSSHQSFILVYQTEPQTPHNIVSATNKQTNKNKRQTSSEHSRHSLSKHHSRTAVTNTSLVRCVCSLLLLLIVLSTAAFNARRSSAIQALVVSWIQPENPQNSPSPSTTTLPTPPISLWPITWCALDGRGLIRPIASQYSSHLSIHNKKTFGDDLLPE